MLVYTDDTTKEYQLSDCNGYEVYRIDYYRTGRRMYQLWRESDRFLKYFYTLKDARKYARNN